MPALTLSIAVYNKPEILRLVLLTCARQTFRDFEVIVADDGSGPEVAEVVEELRREVGAPIRHLWHQDLGWRKNIMLNNAVRQAGSDYMVFIDGDCLLHRKFLQDHAVARQRGFVLSGRRVEFGIRRKGRLSESFITSGRYQRLLLPEFADLLRGDVTDFETGIRLPRHLVRTFAGEGARNILGSNFSVERSDLEKINGFDELYDGPGYGEDSDVQFRLELAGVRCKALRHGAVQFHVFHTRNTDFARTGERFRMVRERGQMRCEVGLY